jgi:hypothetical protein
MSNGMTSTAKGPVESGAEVAQMDERTVDQTLKMIARMPVPERLEERVKAGLQLAEAPGRVLAWPSQRGAAGAWVRSGWARGAAAAAIALVVLGGGWRIYARVEPAQSANGSLPQAQPSGAFSEAGAMRRPLTLTGPKALPPTSQPNGKNVRPGKSDPANARLQGSASHVAAPTQ